MAHPGGRPSEYSGEVLNKAREYLDSCEDEEIQIVKQANSEKGYEMYDNKLKVNLPTIEGLAVHLKIHKDTIYEWEKAKHEDGSLKYPEFSDVISELRAKQARELVNKGLSGDYNPTIAKVLLAKHGYKDAQEIDNNIKGSISLTDLFNKAKEG